MDSIKRVYINDRHAKAPYLAVLSGSGLVVATGHVKESIVAEIELLFPQMVPYPHLADTLGIGGYTYVQIITVENLLPNKPIILETTSCQSPLWRVAD